MEIPFVNNQVPEYSHSHTGLVTGLNLIFAPNVKFSDAWVYFTLHLKSVPEHYGA